MSTETPTDRALEPSRVSPQELEADLGLGTAPAATGGRRAARHRGFLTGLRFQPSKFHGRARIFRVRHVARSDALLEKLRCTRLILVNQSRRPNKEKDLAVA